MRARYFSGQEPLQTPYNQISIDFQHRFPSLFFFGNDSWSPCFHTRRRFFPHQTVCLARTRASPGRAPSQEQWLARSHGSPGATGRQPRATTRQEPRVARNFRSPGATARQEPWPGRSDGSPGAVACKELLLAEIHGSPGDMAPRSHGSPGAMACQGPWLARSHEGQVVGAGVGIGFSSARYDSSSGCRVSRSGSPQWALRVDSEVLPQSGRRKKCPQRSMKRPLRCPLKVPTNCFVGNT